MTNIAKVSEIFQCAATAFGRLAHLTLDLKMCQEQTSDSEVKSSGKWTVVEIDQLKDAVSRFGNDLNKIAEMIETKSLNQIKHKIRSKVFQFERLRRKQPIEEASNRYILPAAKRSRLQLAAEVNEANTSGAADPIAHQVRQYQQQKHETVRPREAGDLSHPVAITPTVTSGTSTISTTMPLNTTTVLINNAPLRTTSGTTSASSGNVFLRGSANTNFVTVNAGNLLAEPAKRSAPSLPSIRGPGSQTQRVVRISGGAPSERRFQGTAPKTGAFVPRIVGGRVQMQPRVEPRKEKMQQRTNYVKPVNTGGRDEYADYDDDDDEEYEQGLGDVDDDEEEEEESVMAKYDDEEEDDLDEDEAEEDEEDDDILDAGQRDDDTDDEDYIVGRR